MDGLDIPDILRIRPEDVPRRRAAWKGRKLTKMIFGNKIIRNEDAATRAFRKEIEKQEAEKKAMRFKLLRERYGKR